MVIGNKLKEVQNHFKYNQLEFARILKVSKTALQNYYKGKNFPGGDIFLNLFKTHPELNANWFFKNSGEMILTKTNDESLESLLKEKDKRLKIQEKYIKVLEKNK